MKNHSFFPFIPSLAILLFAGCGHAPDAIDNFGQPPPGEQLEVFVPGIVSLSGS